LKYQNISYLSRTEKQKIMNHETLHAISKADKLIEAYYEKLEIFPDNEKLKEGFEDLKIIAEELWRLSKTDQECQ
jgi:hypothetical protein